MYNMNRQNEQIYGRNDMVTLDGHNKIYGSLGIAEPYVLQSQEGTSIVARGIKEGSFDDVVTEFRMFGRSEQDTTTGAQLIPFELDAEMTSEDGVTKCVPKKDGFHIELNGTSTQTSKSDIRFVGGSNYLEEDSYDEYENLPAGTYYAKISDNRFILNVIAWRGTNITLISTSTGGSFEVQDGDKFRIFIRPSISAVDATVKAIISKQDDSVMYEPYTGGKPSPSTNYPQEITNAGDDGSIDVEVTGANLLNPELSGNSVNETVYPMLNEGSVALPWEPYKQPQSLTVQTPNGLPGIPVTSGGNYTDADGQQWICDEIDFKRGKYVQKIILITLTGSNLQAGIASEQYGTYVNTNRDNLLRYPSQKLVMSDQYIGVAYDDRTKSVDCYRAYLDNTGRLVIRLPVGDNRSLKEIKVAVDEQKPQFLCALATPIETDLSEEQMQQFLALRSYYPTTVVTNDEDVWMKMSYKALEMGV